MNDQKELVTEFQEPSISTSPGSIMIKVSRVPGERNKFPWIGNSGPDFEAVVVVSPDIAMQGASLLRRVATAIEVAAAEYAKTHRDLDPVTMAQVVTLRQAADTARLRDARKLAKEFDERADELVERMGVKA